jgi:hypothetical protein
MKTDHIETPPAAEKPRKRAARGQKTCEQSDKSKALQSKPQVVNQNGVTGLKVSDAKATAIAALLSQGFSTNRICKELGTSCHTVTAIARNRPELVEQFREVTARNWKVVAALATGELVERIPDMSDNHLGIVAGIATDKAELLSGGATSRVEHTHKPSADEWADMLASLPEADARVIEERPTGDPMAGRMTALMAPVVEVESVGTDVVTGNPSQPDAPTVARDQAATLLDGQSRHVQSLDFEAANSVNPPVVSGLVSTREHLQPSPHALDGGAEGGASSLSSIDPHSSEDAKFFTKHSPSTPSARTPSY